MKYVFIAFLSMSLLSCGDITVPSTTSSTSTSTTSPSTNSSGSSEFNSEFSNKLVLMQQQRKKMAEQLKASYATEDEEKQFLVYEQKLKQDSTQGHELHRLLENHGWPDQSTYGISATKQVTAVLLHSPPKIQEKCLPILLEAAKNNEASKSDVAQIHDKVLIYQGNKQRYGTQISFNKQKGMNDVHPISDEANVNTRRAAMGLNSIEEYLKSKGIKY